VDLDALDEGKDGIPGEIDGFGGLGDFGDFDDLADFDLRNRRRPQAGRQ